jgi:hypothetical protein
VNDETALRIAKALEVITEAMTTRMVERAVDALEKIARHAEPSLGDAVREVVTRTTAEGVRLDEYMAVPRSEIEWCAIVPSTPLTSFDYKSDGRYHAIRKKDTEAGEHRSLCGLSWPIVSHAVPMPRRPRCCPECLIRIDYAGIQASEGP